METANIRKAGYPIRHAFEEFVDRYRYLTPGIPPAHKTDCKAASEKICSTVLSGKDYQIGNTKIFLKDSEDQFLEEERSKILEKYILILQKNIKGWIYRRRFKAMRAAAVVIQKHWRSRGYRSRYIMMRSGYLRLQSKLRSRHLTIQFKKIRERVSSLQAVAKGFVFRKYQKEKLIWKKKKMLELLVIKQKEENDLKKSGNQDYKKMAEANFNQRINELDIGKEEENKNADAVVDEVFNFLGTDESGGTVSALRNKASIYKDVIDKKGNHQVINAAPAEEAKEDLSEFNFRKFAATYFLSNINHQYSKRPLKESLLDLPTNSDIIAAQALWITILRFMGDLAEPMHVSEHVENKSVMSTITQTLSRNFVNSKQYKEAMRQDKASGQRKLINMTLRHKSKINEDEITSQSYHDWLHNRRTSNLEKLHFIIGHGILRGELRDEIYCQICKQLTNNPSKPSHARGWILMSLCVGCFAPSNKFVNYLRAFIREGPPGYAPYCEGRLNRTFKNGSRSQPPSWLELQATKNKENIQLMVTFMDGNSRSVQSDSATTSEEICLQLAKNLNLKDTYGFSLFIILFDKVLSLGNGKDHVMDAISQCEQYAKEQGEQERHAPWRLFFRKEIFTPWHNPTEDPIATDLIYHQIVRGVKFGEYRCSTEGDIAMIAAQQYYIDNGANLNPEHLHENIRNYIPTHFLQAGEKSLVNWEKNIMDAFKLSATVKNRAPALKAKGDIVMYSKLSWPILFSRFFESVRISGPQLNKDSLIIAVNWTGIYMIDDQEQIMMDLSFMEVLYVRCQKNERTNSFDFIIKTIQKEEFVFNTPDAEELTNLITYLIEGLKKRTVFVVATQDYKHPGETSSFLVLKRGDLIRLTTGLTGEALATSTWGYGECNGKSGDFPTEHVHILATLVPPSASILAIFKKEGVLDTTKKLETPTMTTVQRIKLHTLARYASEHFRAGRRTTVARGTVIQSVRRTSKEELWRHTNEPIQMPLLQKLQHDDVLGKEACLAFMAILKYMGDLPSAKPKATNEYTDQIFKGALNNDLLRDEIYCQIMRQLTYNRLQISEDRGWELMWLISGLFVPSPPLLKELQEFLKTRIHPVAQQCLQRLTRTQKTGQRKYPPLSIEVEAIQHKSLHIYHKIYFPDDSDEAFEVDSMTKAKDLSSIISRAIELKSNDGFSLFIMLFDKMYSMPEEEFFFDFIAEVIDFFKKSKPNWSNCKYYKTFLYM